MNLAMTAKEARWLLCEFPPASARLYAEYRRQRESLPPAEARRYAECVEKNLDVLRPAALMAQVCHSACPTSRSSIALQSCEAEVSSAMMRTSLL